MRGGYNHGDTTASLLEGEGVFFFPKSNHIIHVTYRVAKAGSKSFPPPTTATLFFILSGVFFAPGDWGRGGGRVKSWRCLCRGITGYSVLP